MAKDLNRSIKIYIDNSDAMKSAEALKEKIGKLQMELQDLAAAGKKDTEGYAKKEKALQQLQGSYQRYIDKVIETERVLKNLSGATETQLEAVRNQLRRELKKTARDTDEYKAKLQSLIAVEKELSKVTAERKSEVGSQASMWSRAADGFNKYFGLVTSFIATITGVSFTLRKLAEDNAKLDDVYSDVMKTTGMTRDQVVDLNLEFKKMDTRTAREELNNLARDAGKLGLSGKKDIMDFVEAGNQINVSLGEDLGEGAIKNIGKLTDVFLISTKEMDRMDLKGRMLAIGSAINELGASSTASEAYMVNFTQRLGGVAAQAGISIQDILGYASALDQSGQAVEMSATALQKFIMTLMSDTDKFAKLMGLTGDEVVKFNNLVRTDTNAAIKEVLSALSQKGGFQQLIPIFKEMGLDGARAVGVLSALATNIEKVNVAQEISNKAFSDGTSTTNEYNIKNNNLQATLEKQRKAFNDAALELGERLNPVLLKSTNLTTHFIKLLPSVLDFFEKYGKTILSLGTAIGIYMGVVKLVTLSQAKWTMVDTIHYRLLQAKSAFMATYRSALLLLNVVINLITGNTLRAAAAWRMLGASMQANVIGIVITAIVALGYAIYELTKKTKDQLTAAKALSEINREVSQSIAGEKSELDLLLSVARNEKISKEERLKAIKRLNEISPEYLGNLNLENINTQEVTKSIEAYTTALLKNAQAKSIQGKVEAEYSKKNDNLFEIEQKNKIVDNLRKEINEAKIPSIIATKKNELALEQRIIDRLKEENALIDENIKTYTGFYEKTLDAANKGLVNELQANRSFLDQYEKQHADAYSRIQENKKNAFYTPADEARDRVELNMLSKKVDAQRKLVKEQETEYADRVKPQKIVEDVVTPLTDKEINKALQKQKEDLSLMLENLETKHQERLFAIKKQYAEGSIKSESEFNTKTFAQEQAYYLLREQALIAFSKKVTDKALKSDINKQIADLQNKRIDQEIKFQSKLEKIILDANPEAKEKLEYENRLRDYELFGYTREKLSLEIAAAGNDKEKELLQKKLEVFELLEKQHNDNMVKIRKDARSKAKAEANEKFDEDFKARKESLKQDIASDEQDLLFQKGIGSLTGEKAFNAEVALQQKRLAMIREEVEARRQAGLDITSIMNTQRSEELELTNLYVQEYNRRSQMYTQYGEALGSALGNVLTGQADALQSFASVTLDILFDTLANIINAKLIEATAVAIAAQAKATAEAMATPDSVLTFGASGLARAALIGGLITGALTVAKTALKGMLGKGRSASSSSSAASGGTSSGQITVKQAATGKYDVIGQQDGKLYKNVPFAGPAQTGMVYKPTLVGESGAELVVSSPDMKALQKHINYPLIVQAINDARNGHVPQRATGKYDGLSNTNTTPQEDPVQSEMLELLRYLRTNGIDARTYFGDTEYQARLQRVNETNKRFTRS